MTEEYKSMYLDQRWKDKRRKIYELDNNSCIICNKSINCVVHHIKYGKTPWDVRDCDLVVLCDSCHESIHKHKIKIDCGYNYNDTNRNFYFHKDGKILDSQDIFFKY
jgi:ribosomal protein L32